VKISNNSANDALFNLAADVPPGFTTTFKHGYDTAEITGVPIKAGANDTVTLEVKANAGIAAGKYPIALKVLAGKLAASTELGLEITGSPTLSLSGPQQRLSGEATAGQATTFPFTIANTGSAPAQNVKFSASAPSDWTVSFEPDRGAPPKVQFENLSSWADNSDYGVKYFSGTATYSKTIDIPADLLKTGTHLWLDLGDVEDIARVEVNGKPVGVAWKAPFRVDLSGAVTAGTNKISIQVTNLWVNRLIGDQQPWSVKKYAFTDFAPYKANSPLLPSGLLGPLHLESVSQQ